MPAIEKSMGMVKKMQFGDVIEIPTKRGTAYAQYTHYHEEPPEYGALIRVLPGIYPERPQNLEALISGREQFSVFFPVQAAVNRGIVRVVTRMSVPDYAREFPLFRGGTINPATGKVGQWWLWDGSKSWKVENLSDEQLDLPIRGICNDTALIERIERGWTPRNAEALMQAARLRNQIEKTQTTQVVKGITHFLLFPDRRTAEHAKQLAEDAGFEAILTDNGNGFTVKVPQGAPLKEEYVEHVTVQLSEIAQKTGGTYDAWETALG